MISSFSRQVKDIRNSHWAAFLFFAFYLTLGLSIVTDYGMSFDEHWGRENGIINAKYIADKLAPGFIKTHEFCVSCKILTEYRDVDHGPVFEIGTTFLEFVLKIKGNHDIYLLRHICTFLLFFLSSIFFYLLLFQRFRKPVIALAGVLMLVASPRFFAETFYNAKDIPFLSMIIISSFTLLQFLRKKNLASAVLHALACGITIDIRILGLLLPVITVFLSLMDLKFIRKDGEPARKILPVILVYLLFIVGFIILFWPYLWEKPFVRFPEILARSSKYPWTGSVLYFGQFYKATQLPWHYLPVWIFISTPLLYIFSFLTGSIFVAIRLIQSRFLLYRNRYEQFDLAMAGLFIIPVAATLILKLVLYDGWRHMFFIYAPFIYLAVLGLVNLYNWLGRKFTSHSGNLLQKGLLAVWALGMLQIVGWMILNHPYQNVYFSVLKGPEVRQQMELDYWGLSYRQGLQYVLKASDKPEIKVKVNNLPGELNNMLLPADQRTRLKYVTDSTQADYFLTEYRFHPQDYLYKKEQEVYTIDVDGYKIMSVFKLK